METDLPEELQQQLAGFQIYQYDEVTLRQQLEVYVSTYTLIKLAAWPARRWKCQYRLLLGDVMHDAQSVSEAYALALLAQLSRQLLATEVPDEAQVGLISDNIDQSLH